MALKKLKTNPRICPNCDTRSVEFITDDLDITLGNGRVEQYKNVPYWICNNCGERMLGPQSYEVMEKQKPYKERKSIKQLEYVG